MSFTDSASPPTTAINSLLQPDHHPDIDPPNMQANRLRRLFGVGLPFAIALSPIVFGDRR
jgi:hypothetical protein